MASSDEASLFQRIADRVSAAMGRPTNILVWLVLVVGWTAMGPYLSHHPVLPAWATSDGYNFPLNLVTTVAELFIGFLIGAASNRSERNLELTLGKIADLETQILTTEQALRDEIAVNTQLTQAVHNLTAEVHELVCK